MEFGVEGQRFSYWGPREGGNPNNTSARFEVKDGVTAQQIAESIGVTGSRGGDPDMLAESAVQGYLIAPMGVGRKNVKISVSEYVGDYDGDPLHGKPVATISTW